MGRSIPHSSLGLPIFAMLFKPRYLVFFAVCFLACVVIVLFFGQWPFVRGFLGDFLVMGLIYFLGRAFLPLRPAYLMAAVSLLAYTVEGLQYADFVNRIGLADNQLVSIVVGTVYAPTDLLAYTLGAVAFWALDWQGQ